MGTGCTKAWTGWPISSKTRSESQAVRSERPTHPDTPPVSLLQPCPFLLVPVWPGPWVSCPHAHQEPCLPAPSLCPPTWPVPNCCPNDESFQLTGFQTKHKVVMVSWGDLLPRCSWGLGGGWGSILSVCFVWLWLLCSRVCPLPSSPPPACFPLHHHLLSVLHGNCTGLSVCVHVCACIYMYREKHLGARERSGWVEWRSGRRAGPLPTPACGLPLHVGV